MDSNKALMGIVLFVMSGRFSAVISESDGRINAQRNKLLQSSYKIKTYVDIANGTFLRTENGGGKSDDELKSILLGKIKEIEQTYAKYLELHLYLVHTLHKNPIDSIYRGRSTKDLQTIAVELLTKCIGSFTRNGFAAPKWMNEYSELLNGLRFNTGNADVEVVGPPVDRFENLIHKLNQIFVDFDDLPNTTGCVFDSKGFNESDFGKQRRMPWMELRDYFDFYKNDYKSKGCKPPTAGVRLERGQVLDVCRTATFFHHVGYNLVNLQLILDVNNELLPYGK